MKSYDVRVQVRLRVVTPDDKNYAEAEEIAKKAIEAAVQPYAGCSVLMAVAERIPDGAA